MGFQRLRAEYTGSNLSLKVKIPSKIVSSMDGLILDNEII